MKDDEKPKISYLKNVKKNDDGSVDIELSGNEEDLISDEDISPKEFVGMLKSIFLNTRKTCLITLCKIKIRSHITSKILQ